MNNLNNCTFPCSGTEMEFNTYYVGINIISYLNTAYRGRAATLQNVSGTPLDPVIELTQSYCIFAKWKDWSGCASIKLYFIKLYLSQIAEIATFVFCCHKVMSKT